MINLIVKFQSGALGNFLACILHKDIKPIHALDFGDLLASTDVLQDKILHTGAYDNPNDKHFKAYHDRKKHTVVSHNNPNFDNWITEQEKAKNVFIDLNSHFVEYRLNSMIKMPELHNKANQSAIDVRWKNYEFPISCDEARRIVRLHENKEHKIAVNKDKDVVFPFGNFYITNKDLYIQTYKELTEKLNLDTSVDELSMWFDSFNQGQKVILDRARIIYDCIHDKKFIPGLNENEKGIIIGYHAVKDNIDTAEYFIQTFKELC
jgi:hypothetical protein